MARMLFALVLLGCAAAVLVQWNLAAKIRSENQALRDEAQKLQAQAGDSAELERLRVENQELERLRKDNRELPRLRNEVRQLREQMKTLGPLQAENQRLRGALQAQANQPPAQPLVDTAALEQAREKAESIQCVNNLKQIGLAARIWANDHKVGVLPSDFVSMRNELSTPKILVCPGDKAKAAAANWNEFNAASNLSYQMVTPGAKETEPQTIFVHCPHHGHVGLADGSVQMGAVKRQ